MTLAETILQHLEDNGMFRDQAEAVLARFKEDPLGAPLTSAWDKKASGYPQQFMPQVLLNLRAVAVKYIDETCPEVWFRPMFVD